MPAADRPEPDAPLARLPGKSEASRVSPAPTTLFGTVAAVPAVLLPVTRAQRSALRGEQRAEMIAVSTRGGRGALRPAHLLGFERMARIEAALHGLW